MCAECLIRLNYMEHMIRGNHIGVKHQIIQIKIDSHLSGFSWSLFDATKV